MKNKPIKNENEKKRIAVVSGAMGYVGRAVSIRLAEDGLIVVLLYNHSTKDTVNELLDSLSGNGHRSYRCNLQNELEVSKTINQIEKEVGKVYSYINTAGTKPQRKAFLNSDLQEIKDQFEVNTFGSFSFLITCGKKLKEYKKGVIIGVTTLGVIYPEAGRFLGGYLPAKFALQGALSMLKEELGPCGVRVYSVAPGFMPGGMNQDIPESFRNIIREKNLSKKLTSAVDVAEKISYLCSDFSENEKSLTYPVAEEYFHNQS